MFLRSWASRLSIEEFLSPEPGTSHGARLLLHDMLEHVLCVLVWCSEGPESSYYRNICLNFAPKLTTFFCLGVSVRCTMFFSSVFVLSGSFCIRLFFW